MTVLNPPSWLQAGSYNARADRIGVGSLLDVPGVSGTTSLVVTQTLTPSMGVLVSAGAAYVQNTFSAAQGYYAVVNDGAITINLDASHANFARLDAIIVQVHDSQYAGTLNMAVIDKVTGTPSNSPSIGAIPNNSIILATILVPASSSSVVNGNIDTSLRQIARLKSSLTDSFRGVTSLTRPGSPYIGQSITETDTGALRVYVGGTEGWRIVSPSTALNVPSTARPAGVKVWPGFIIFETDTKKLYTWNGARWVYSGGGGSGEIIDQTFNSWTSVYKVVAGAAAVNQRLTLWRDSEGRYNLEGAFTNAVTLSSYGSGGMFQVARLPAGTYPPYDMWGQSIVFLPGIASDASTFRIKGSVSTSSALPGSPGSIIWQPNVTRTTSVGMNQAIFWVPRMSWPGAV